jgi:hypothetical protein
VTYRTCPRCDDVKCLRLVGSYEPDTNSYPSPEVDEQLSCKCDLSAEEWEGIMAGLSMDDFIWEPDY